MGKAIDSMDYEDLIQLGVEVLRRRKAIPNLCSATERFSGHLTTRQEDLLCQLFYLRELEEKYENGLISGNVAVGALLLYTPHIPAYIPKLDKTPLQLVCNLRETEKLYQYYSTQFSKLDKETCAFILQMLIRCIDPDKHLAHPYLAVMSELTKPTWWPSDVRHREPRRLRKHGSVT
ncbi:hypothetical protein BDV24DRAFT_170490 [Aspergillus arachidicola]|uniref:Subtelomeric hrmA-associated cluster protein AFUB-079030/YDR124W-like helical bundle domain-containing protein n=1 Tax=Aspergillus arachidicola TaxID=656916 RepID=A0A5N6XPV0_9EURO|nr:hypothetical protein BDV24DRAFT_170490 [Aspergillus arachidicola]